VKYRFDSTASGYKLTEYNLCEYTQDPDSCVHISNQSIICDYIFLPTIDKFTLLGVK